MGYTPKILVAYGAKVPLRDYQRALEKLDVDSFDGVAAAWAVKTISCPVDREQRLANFPLAAEEIHHTQGEPLALVYFVSHAKRLEFPAAIELTALFRSLPSDSVYQDLISVWEFLGLRQVNVEWQIIGHYE